MGAEIVMGMTARVRQLVVESWPDRCAQWDRSVWDRWAEELGRYTETELEKAVMIHARAGHPFPPTWGQVYQLAKPMRRERMDRIAEHRWKLMIREGGR
jgi:hypothetical protein